MGRKKRQQEREDRAEKLETMGQAGGALSAYRPHTQEAYNRGMQQQMEMRQPINNMVAAMFGGAEGATTAGPDGNLVSPEMMATGMTSMAPGFADPASPAALAGPAGPTAAGSPGNPTAGGVAPSRKPSARSGGGNPRHVDNRKPDERRGGGK